MPSIGTRIKNAWSAFTSRDPTMFRNFYGSSGSYRPDRHRSFIGGEKTIISSINTRIAIDVSALKIKHVKLDNENAYIGDMNSGLNSALNFEANIDQTGRSFIQDVVMSMLDEGCVAIVPTTATDNPMYTDAYDIGSFRTGKIVEWFPEHVRIRLYNDITGLHDELILPKSIVGIVENPLYSVMNEPNSTLKRLIRTLNILDVVDEQSGSGKLDLIIQLPYAIKTTMKREEAEKKRKDIEMQLTGSKYGIAYIDSTEKITQLNRSVDNNLMQQIEYLTSMLYSQLGMTSEVIDGTADEKTMLNYYNRTIEPIISSICDELKRKFISKTGRSQGQSVTFFRDPFKLVPVSELAEIADKFTRNEILTSNEVRGFIGIKPSDDPEADKLRNKNLNDRSGLSNSSGQNSDMNQDDNIS